MGAGSCEGRPKLKSGVILRNRTRGRESWGGMNRWACKGAANFQPPTTGCAGGAPMGGQAGCAVRPPRCRTSLQMQEVHGPRSGWQRNPLGFAGSGRPKAGGFRSHPSRLRPHEADRFVNKTARGGKAPLFCPAPARLAGANSTPKSKTAGLLAEPGGCSLFADCELSAGLSSPYRPCRRRRDRAGRQPGPLSARVSR